MTTRPQWTSTDVLAELARNRAWLQTLGVRSLGLFGSYRRGTQQHGSDMDFLIDLEHPSFDGYMSVKFWLEDTFGLAVDLVLVDTLKPRLRPVIEIARKTQELQPWDRRASPALAAFALRYGFLVR